MMTWQLSDFLTRVKASPCRPLLAPLTTIQQHRPFPLPLFSLLIRRNIFPLNPKQSSRFSCSPIWKHNKKRRKNSSMEHNLRRNFPAPASDPLACLSVLTQTNSDSPASGVTIESLRDPTHNATPQGETMVWTNEKHNLYLDFLEASFVKQLHYSTSLRGCHPRGEMWEPCPTPQLPAHSSSHQFSALQDGCYQKSNDPLLDSTADSSDIRESPLHHLTSADKSSSETFPLSRETVVPDGGTYLRSNTTLGGCTTGKFGLNLLANFLLPIAFIHFCYESPRSMLTSVYLCICLLLERFYIFFQVNVEWWLYIVYNESIWPLIEVSDQNFVDEDQREKTNRVSGAKRLKMTT